MLAHHSPFLQTSLGGAAPHYHPQKPHSVNRGKKTHPLLALMLSFITPMKGESEHEGVSSPLLLFFSLNSSSPLLIFTSFPTHFKKRGKERKEAGREGEQMRVGRWLVITAMQNGHLPCLLAFEIQSIVWDGK